MDNSVTLCINGPMHDERFLDHAADSLASLPGVQAVALGGSRAQGTHRPDSDWDFAVYYRGRFDPQDLRDLAGRSPGWEGQVSELGGWGGGVFNGGAWLRIGGRAVDVHYRDLDVVEREVGRAACGDFDIEPLMFHLAGIPTYLVVGELAILRVLRGTLTSLNYPEQLRRKAPPTWSERAELTLSYARSQLAPLGLGAQCAGMVAVAAVEYGHAILASRGEWTTNERQILERAGLAGVNALVRGMGPQPDSLVRATDDVSRLCRQLLEDAASQGAMLQM